MFTIWEKFGTLRNLKVSFVGDGDNNVTNSLMLLCARLGVDITVGSPRKYTISKKVLSLVKAEAQETHAKIRVTNEAKSAVRNADVIYTDVWVSMVERIVKSD